MKVPCDRLHEFVDGELSRDERAAFFQHLNQCPRCSVEAEALLQLDSSIEEAVQRPGFGGVALGGARQGRIARWRLFWLGGGLAVAAAAVALVVVRPRQPAPPAPVLAQLDQRPIEARVGPPEMDRHAPYNPQLGGSSEGSRSYRELAALEGRGPRVLASRLLQLGDLRGASAVLASADARSGRERRRDRSLDNERAVLALLERKPEQAVTFLPMPAEAGASSQSLWNRGLALRDLKLPHAAASTFQAVAARKEAGWSAEAGALAQASLTDAERWQKRFDQTLAEGRALIAEQKLPSDATLNAQRDFVRLFFYDAVRSAGTAEELARLRPLAETLDRTYGAQDLGRFLGRAVRADVSRRRPLAERYRGYAASYWQNLVPAEVEGFLTELRRAGERDMLVGALLATGRALGNLGEFTRVTRQAKDPWFDLTADEVAAQAPGLPVPEQEALLRGAIRRAAAVGLELRRFRLEQQLVSLLIRQHRSHEALALLGELRTRARQLDDLMMERIAVHHLVTVSHFRRQRELMAAYAQEALLWKENVCRNRQAIRIMLAQDAVLARDWSAARANLQAISACGDSTDPSLDVAVVYSDLARQGDPADLEALRRYVGGRPLGEDAVGRIIGKLLETRAAVRSRPELRAELATAIAELEAIPEGHEDRNKALLLAFQALTFEAIERRQFEAAFTNLARQRRTPVPDGCVLGLSLEESGRLGIVVRDRNGAWDGSSRQLDGPVDDRVVPPEIRAKLDGCPEVAVVAEPAFHGEARLLGPEVAWSFREGALAGGGKPAGFERHVVVSDVEPPAELGLEPLPAWKASASGPPVQAHLVGPAATPGRALAAIGDADLVQFHAHGLLDTGVADAAMIALSPAADGTFALTAGQIRRTRLTRQPLVILSACDAADVDIHYNPEWSLPVAFIRAGARGVFAAASKIPSDGANRFFSELLVPLRAGTSPALALRQLRQSWIGRGQDWVKDVLLFQ